MITHQIVDMQTMQTGSCNMKSGIFSIMGITNVSHVVRRL